MHNHDDKYLSRPGFEPAWYPQVTSPSRYEGAIGAGQDEARGALHS